MNIYENVDLSLISNWKVGGKAKYLIDIENIEDYSKSLSFIKEKNIKALVIGKTSNLLFDSVDLNIALLRLGQSFFSIKKQDSNLIVGASTPCYSLARKAQQLGLSGLEHIVGIPATIGGLIYMNGGSKRKTISENIVSVTSIDNDGNIIERNREQCEFSYRKSIFQKIPDELILSVELKLSLDDSKKIRKENLQILRDRRKKFPRKQPSCGSVFISNPVNYKTVGPPGKIIEDLGLKGLKKNKAQISDIHANFIVNIGGANSNDILFLVKEINDKARLISGIELESEGLFVNKNGYLTPLHLVNIDE
ncbi:UDP-N-acetylmuramate dehydrogenase [Vibrio palustris]|uniref:UDP-N-acetylenolpyruvoylglucosamine reductase n=1 Tax=Vibrio palustris TaxID=1918946 RepID=A0A1R4B3M8_9VIBR|nr:UDP-N-acetylmuramate dehydrogenase [Vibrio palustris]SJL83519.1 UDP-N-acetylenolpyruvoylglucosamine reductase [Vibrio palustris]